MQLVIGNKNYSSWSLRPWLGMKVAGIAFDEVLLPLYEEESVARRLAFSPTGKVPLLVDGELKIWDSLAIAEYIAEKYPEVQLWPKDIKARAIARAICAEIHAEFTALRSVCSMDIRARKQVEISTAAQADIDRITTLWGECRSRFGEGGDYLFGQFSWADAYCAPIVTRCITYNLKIPRQAHNYVETILALPAMQEWIQAAHTEPLVN